MVDIDKFHFHYAKMSQNQISVTSFVGSVPSVQKFDWKYVMRRSMQEIIPGVFLGPYSAAMKYHLSDLINEGITHIICVRQNVEAHIVRPHFLDKFKYLILDIADTTSENIIPHFAKVIQFIDECRTFGGKVLIHGNNGVSRSATLVLAYVMQKFGLSYSEAFSLVQKRRFCIKPNEGFVAQLLEFEPIYRAQQTLQHGQCSNNNNLSKKRKAEQLDLDSGMLPLPPPPSPETCFEEEGLNIMDLSLT